MTKDKQNALAAMSRATKYLQTARDDATAKGAERVAQEIREDIAALDAAWYYVYSQK